MKLFITTSKKKQFAILADNPRLHEHYWNGGNSGPATTGLVTTPSNDVTSLFIV